MSINLLPDELKPKSTTIKTSKKLRKAAILMLTVFLICAFLVGGTLLVFQNLLNISGRRQTELSAEIENLKITETRLVLIKDRIAKISQLEQEGTTDFKFANVRRITENSDGLANITDIIVDQNGITVSASFLSSTQLGAFLDRLSQETTFANLRMDSLKFSQNSGYEVVLNL